MNGYNNNHTTFHCILLSQYIYTYAHNILYLIIHNENTIHIFGSIIINHWKHNFQAVAFFLCFLCVCVCVCDAFALCAHHLRSSLFLGCIQSHIQYFLLKVCCCWFFFHLIAQPNRSTCRTNDASISLGYNIHCQTTTKCAY